MGLYMTNILFEEKGLSCVYPYGGYKFLELSAHCDPFIFSNQVNKWCLRKTTEQLLPKEIINNVVKSGQPGLTLTKILQENDNTEIIVDYLNRHSNSTLVKENELLKSVLSSRFGNKEFCALALIMFEDQIRNKYGKNIDYFR